MGLLGACLDNTAIKILAATWTLSALPGLSMLLERGKFGAILKWLSPSKMWVSKEVCCPSLLKTHVIIVYQQIYFGKVKD